MIPPTSAPNRLISRMTDSPNPSVRRASGRDRTRGPRRRPEGRPVLFALPITLGRKYPLRDRFAYRDADRADVFRSPPDPVARRVLHLRLRDHGRRRLGRPHGRLARTGRTRRRRARLSPRGSASSAGRADVRPTRRALSGCRRRDRIRRAHPSPVRRLRRGVDYGALLRDRLPVGDGRDR